MPTGTAVALYDRSAIRPHAMGSFRALLGAVAQSPAMLFYLDNWTSTAGAINENYARELLELHTLGVDGGYTQADVVDVARALTGWTITPTPRPAGNPYTLGPTEFAFNATAHDSSAKRVLGHPLPAGRGMEDGSDVLDILARHPSTARHIAAKLVRRLVSDVPPPALVERAADTFRRTDGSITEVVRTIVTSDEFFSRSAFRAKVKTPFELVVSTRRALEAPPDTSGATDIFLAGLGQRTFGRASPEGWPETGDAWVNSGTVMQRILFASDVARGVLTHLPATHWRGWAEFGERAAHEQAQGIVHLLLGGIAAESTMRQLRAVTIPAPRERLVEMLALVLGSPEFQRR
jgi:uncharacterized protein (DUF1800 family)